MSRATKRCRDCGAPFTASAADITVRCPACRASARRASAPPTPHRRAETCSCGKTVKRDSTGRSTGWTWPRCEA